MARRPQRVALFIVVVVSLLAWLVPAATAGSGDLDNDGFDDLAVGVPDEDISQADDAGVVNILRGGSSGISARGDRLVTQRDLGGSIEPMDRFGNSVAYGDFDGDGFDDLALGAPTEDYRGAESAGVVHIVFGSSRGANRRDTQLISQAGKMAGSNERGDFFGASLAAGNINGDRYDDLVVGVPGENVGGKIAAGAIVVAYGGPRGLRTGGSQFITQKGKVPGAVEDFDNLGVAVVVGDFNGDPFGDVAIGVPGEGIGTLASAGNVAVLYGRATGLDRAGVVFQQGGDIPDSSEAGDFFGRALTAADFDGNGIDDLAVGVPGEDLFGIEDAGAVVVLRGGSSGLSGAGARQLFQDGGGAGVGEADDAFGLVLASGDFDRNGVGDLAVGVPDDQVDGIDDGGSVVIFPGAGGGPSQGGARSINQGPVPGAEVQLNDRMGASLRSGDFNGDGTDDLAISAPNEDAGRKRDSGIVYVVSGTAGSGLDPARSVRIHQGTKDVEGAAEAGDLFGTGL